MFLFVLVGCFIVLLSIGLPIGIALGLTTTVVILWMSNLNVILVAQNAVAALDSFPLLALPFFVLAGNLMFYGGISRRLLNLADAMVGRVIGGLGMVTTVACMFFAAISGSGPATVSAIGTIIIPSMKDKKYDVNYAAAITAAAGSIGVIIPPSIPFVIYAVITGASVADLFLAGVVPGLIMGFALMLTNFIMSKKYGYKGRETAGSEKWSVFKESIWALVMPVIILGGIYGGIFTPTEAAVVGCVYALVIGIFVYREIGIKEVYDALKDTGLITGATVFTLAFSTSFATLITMKQIPNMVANYLSSVSDSPFVIMMIINVFLLMVGCFVDNISACIILSPILLPIVTKLGVDIVHFGVIMTVNLAIGFCTPPYGINLFVAAAVADTSVAKISKFILPFILAMIITLLITTYIPPVSMFLPTLLK
ncbi:MAG: TRAP transporter large permease subunit [Synergistaceae bacterium]|jgi:C4-dicarboxylate transporter DctM subunit|nr:TRAP transporter large permease subunit [Synergistaceae bacterium]